MTDFVSMILGRIKDQDEEEITVLDHTCENCHYSGYGGLHMCHCRLLDARHTTWHHCRFWKQREE